MRTQNGTEPSRIAPVHGKPRLRRAPLRREALFGRIAFTTTELLVVLAVMSILSTVSLTVYVNSQKGTSVRQETRKWQRLFGLARSWAVSRAGYYQVTYWSGQPSYWIDETDAAGTIIRSKIVTPEPVEELVEVSDVTGGIPDPLTNTISFRFFPDGTSDDALIHFIFRTANHTDPTRYFALKLYGPTGRAEVFENQRSP